MVAGVSLLLTILAQSAIADSLYRLALRLPESGLAVEARAHPLGIREAVSEAMARSIRPGGEEALEAARRLAGAYAAAWRDSFLTRQVDRFQRSEVRQRAGKIRADSLRRAGVTAFSRAGPGAAIALWRRALGSYRALADTAGMAGTLDNIGAGLVRMGRLDSAEVYLLRARALAVAVGDIRVEANAAGHLGDLSAERGALIEARERYAEAGALRSRIGDTRGLAADHNNLGLLAQDLGDLEEARRQFETALGVNRREGRPELAATNLVNLAGLASLEGDFFRGGSLYRDAVATWRRREEWAEAAVALHGLAQLELRRGDYPAARVAAAEALAIYERTGPAADALQVRRLLADVLAAAGDIQGALDELQLAQTLATTAGAGPRVGAALALSRADLAVRLNALGDAEQRYRLAERLYRSAGDREGEAEAQHGRGLLALARDDTPRAEALLTAALRGQTAVRSRRAAALTRLSLGRVFWQRGDTTRARRQLSQAVQELEQLGDVVALAEALGERGALEGEAGAPAAAESFYRAALRRLEGRPVPETAWRLRSGLGMALKARGAHDAAARELRAAVEALDRPSRSLVLPERRSAFLADKWETYAQLALVERARGLPALAFETSERLRAREMLELLDRGRVAAAPDAAPDLVGREQDLRRRITELTREVDRLVPGREAVRGPDLTRVPSATRQSLLQAQEEYGDLLLRMRERAPRHAEFVSPRPASWREIARRLEPDQALVSYLLSDSGSVAFVVTPDTMVAVDLEVRRHELARLVEFARGTLERPLSDSLWQGPFRRLHAYLVAPVEETRLLARTSRLVLAPHGELHYLPFSALLPERGGRLFGERYQLSVTPSASAWLTLGDRPAAGNPSGVLAVAPRADALPASRQEVAAIGRLVAGDVQVRVGRSASEELFRREARGRRIVHLATYGVLNKQNPLFSFIELAGGDGHDGRLEVHEVFGLELTADLVVLSACQTGLGSGALADVPAGDDWVGLTRAFLHAGARQVIATLWAVDDWATAALMERFYRSLAGGNDPARALAEAQRALRGETATAHPRYWAGFVLVGGRDSHRLSGAQP